MLVLRTAVRKELEDVREWMGRAGVEIGECRHLLVMETWCKGGPLRVGAMGLETCGEDGLLRSFVMERELWEDTGFPLFRAVLREAEQCGIKRLFLCAGTSLSLFRSLGFTEMDPALLPEEWQEWVVEKEGVWMVCLLSAQESLS